MRYKRKRSERPWWQLERLYFIFFTLPLTGCKAVVLDPYGPVESAENTILFDSLAIMLVIVVPTIVVAMAFAWWFRASNPKAQYRPDFVYSGRVEMLTWGVPLLTIMLLGGVTWVSSHRLDPAEPMVSKKPPLEVQVVSLDWKWLFIYPAQRIASVNQLVIPVDTPIHFSLTSASVMNAFFVPQLGSMIYTMNGMASQLNLQADKTGTFDGLSTHYSGDGFSDMHFKVRALPSNDFTQWVMATSRTGPALDARSYASLAKQSINDRPMTYSSADPGLFQNIVTQMIPPAAGPHIGKPGVVTSSRTE